MSISTISTSIQSFVTLGSGNYADGLTITGMGTVASGLFQETPGSYQTFQVVLGNAADTLFNAGLIEGGSAQPEFGGNTYGLTGVYLQAGYVSNSGQIMGGVGYSLAAGVLQTGGTLENRGTITGGGQSLTGSLPTDQFFGVDLTNGMLVNYGSIAGGYAGDGLDISGGTAVNHGYIVAGAGTQIYAELGIGVSISGGSLLNTGTITGLVGQRDKSSPAIVMSGGTLSNTGLIETQNTLDTALQAYGAVTVSNSGTIAGEFMFIGTSLGGTGMLDNTGLITHGVTNVSTSNNVAVFDSGTIQGGISLGAGSVLTLAPGTVIRGSVSVGTLDLAAGSTTGRLNMNGSFTSLATIAFDPGAAWALAGTSAELAAGESITGFAAGDTLTVDGFTATSHAFAAGELTLTNATASLTLDLSGTFASVAVVDGTLGTQIYVPCFCPGTGIATPHGDVPVEDLCIGDEVETLFAGPQRIKWIGRRSYEGRFIAGNHLALPVCVKAGALAEGVPGRDLWVSPGHALYVDGALVQAWRLVNGVSVVQAAAVEAVSYIHIELDAHEVILAEACPVESFYDDACRGQFANAATYPGGAPGLRCAPLLGDGFGLQAIQAQVAQRAGVTGDAAPSGNLRGYVDVAGPTLCSGWAQDEAAPEAPICLDIFANGRRVGRVLANGYRADLRAAGLGSGCHGFTLTLPEGCTGPIEVRRTRDGALLGLTAAALAA